MMSMHIADLIINPPTPVEALESSVVLAYTEAAETLSSLSLPFYSRRQ